MKTPIGENSAETLAMFFKIFGDPSRIRILSILEKEEMNVTQLTGSLGMNQSAVSHQLKTLKQARVVKTRRMGKSIIYSLADHHVSEIFRCGLEHCMEDKNAFPQS